MIHIEGQSAGLVPMSKEALKRLWVEVKWTFDFYNATLMGHRLVILSPKDGITRTPQQLEQYSRRLAENFEEPIVFLLPPMPTYLRNRLVSRGVFFIINGKYAFLPFLYANRKISERTVTERLTPAAQYILLWQLQVGDAEGMSVKELAEVLPLSYLSISRAVTVLEDLGLCTSERNGKTKRLHFPNHGKNLWEQAQPFLLSPIKEVFYCDRLTGDGLIGGVNALAHYTHLNPEEQKTIVLDAERMKTARFDGRNPIEGEYRVEIWKYSPIDNDGYVDSLSLALSLKDDNDERVQNEIEQMIEKLWYTD